MFDSTPRWRRFRSLAVNPMCEEHCVPEAGMQWHILVWHMAFSVKHP